MEKEFTIVIEEDEDGIVEGVPLKFVGIQKVEVPCLKFLCMP